MRVVYIAGPFRAKTPWLIEQNVRRAEHLALQVWSLGVAVICPHTNTRFFDGAADDAIWLEGDRELVKRSDAVMMVEGWENSVGATSEMKLAIELGLPVFTSLSELASWVKKT